MAAIGAVRTLLSPELELSSLAAEDVVLFNLAEARADAKFTGPGGGAVPFGIELDRFTVGI